MGGRRGADFLQWMELHPVSGAQQYSAPIPWTGILDAAVRDTALSSPEPLLVSAVTWQVKMLRGFQLPSQVTTHTLELKDDSKSL